MSNLHAWQSVFAQSLSSLQVFFASTSHFTWYPIISGEWNRRNIFKTDIKYQPASDQRQSLPTSAVADAHTVRVISGICHFACVQVCALTEKQLDVSTPNIWRKNTVHGSYSVCIEPEVKLSKVNVTWLLSSALPAWVCRSIRLCMFIVINQFDHRTRNWQPAAPPGKRIIIHRLKAKPTCKQVSIHLLWHES